MPELPEVETVARELRKSILNREIVNIEAIWKKSFENRCKAELTGQKIVSISRKGKYLIFNLFTSSLIVHLRMTGQLLYRENDHPENVTDYTRVILKLNNGMLLFKDVRKFGRIYHIENPVEFLAHVGPDALDKIVTPDYFIKVLRSGKMSIKAFLMSQKHISGMGNIYTDEALFLSGIHPAVFTNKISKPKALKLYRNMLFVLNESIKNMGSTISDYRDPAGNKGLNQFYFNVYKQAGKLCKKCGAVIEKIKFAGRGTHFCPNCQKP
jgi:formamidopyrimidine-DNA glycosylase